MPRLPDRALKYIGQSLRAEREAQQITVAGLAVTTGYDPTYVSHVEAGRRQMHLDFLIGACYVLDIEPSEILGDAKRWETW